MKTIKQMADEYAASYPPEYRQVAYKAWLDGRKSKTKKEDLDLSFVEERYMELFLYWLNYKKERKQQYTQSGAETCYHRWVKLCGGNLQMMIDAVEFSVANNYQGIYLPKYYNGGNNQKGNGYNTNVFQMANRILQED